MIAIICGYLLISDAVKNQPKTITKTEYKCKYTTELEWADKITEICNRGARNNGVKVFKLEKDSNGRISPRFECKD